MKTLTALILFASASVAFASDCTPGFSPACDPDDPLTTETQYVSHLRCRYVPLDIDVEIRAARPFDLTDPDQSAQCLRVREAIEMEVLP